MIETSIQKKIYLYALIFEFEFVQSLLLSSSPLNLEESRSLKILLKKKFMKKTMSLNLLWVRSFYFLFFLLRYYAVFIKQPSCCSFGKKSCKMLENFLENKESPLSSPLHEFGKILVFWGLDNVEYGNKSFYLTVYL